jgi:hypothetical protein
VTSTPAEPAESAEPAEPAELAAARRRLAQAQIELLAALVAGGPPPAGFDPGRIRVQADALVAKRRHLVAALRPDLVEAAGADFRARFDVYARRHPRPAAGAHADAAAFARTVQVHPTSRPRPPRRPPLFGSALPGRLASWLGRRTGR